ncbi:MAG TPA: YueI family protein [Virgibacillus sp.]|nr:YueI family protein [Virgibacillus sp.]
MTNKSVDDYLTDGIYGVQRPKEVERRKYLGTLRERIVLVLTIGQVMQDAGITELNQAMKSHPNTQLLLNGEVASRFLMEEKRLADKHQIPYTMVTNTEFKTKVGAVLTYDHAVNIEDVYLEDVETEKKKAVDDKNNSLFSRLINRFK